MINIWAILSSMVLSVVLGFIWYGPLFGKKWMQLSGIVMPEEKPSFGIMIKPIILSLIGAFFMTYVLSYSIIFHDVYYEVGNMASALSMGFFLWIGLIVPAYLNLTGWEGKSWILFFINAGYWLVFLLISSAIFVAFS